MVKKITITQQRSTEQRSAVIDSRRRLTNFQTLVSQSVSAVLRQSDSLTTVKCYVKSSKCPRERINNLLRMLSESATFSDFQLSQGIVASYCRCGGNVCSVYITFLRINWGKIIAKIGLHLPKLLPNIKEYTCLRHSVVTMDW